MGLTQKRIASLREPGRYHDEHGLYLQVRNEDNKSWMLRYERNGKERWHGLGALHVYGLDEARDRARQARQQLRAGVDPIAQAAAEKRARALEAAKNITFEEAATQYFRQHESRWRNAKVRAAVMSGLKRWVFPIIGKTQVRAVDTAAILRVLEQKVDGGTFWTARTETAGKLRGIVKNVFDWAKVRGYREGDNPAEWVGNLDQVLPGQSKVAPVAHMKAMAFADLPGFMSDLRARPAIAARAAEFCVLTAARSGEVLGATWAEIDFDAATWTVAASRMKAGRPHKVPLSKQALALLKALPRENEFVFIGPTKGRGLSNMSMLQLLKRMGHDDITMHGFRSCFRDWAEECTSFAGSVSEAALAHIVGDKVEAAYRRGDLFEKRRKLMQAWATYCATPARTGNVVAIRGR